jgi:hypothetical protein
MASEAFGSNAELETRHHQRHVFQQDYPHCTRASPLGNHPRPYPRAEEAATAPEASAEMLQRPAGSHGSANACHHRVLALV